MFRKLSFASNVNSKEKVKSLKQASLTSKSSTADDDLDDVAVISCGNPAQTTYGSRGLCSILLLFGFYFFSFFYSSFTLANKFTF